MTKRKAVKIRTVLHKVSTRPVKQSPGNCDSGFTSKEKSVVASEKRRKAAASASAVIDTPTSATPPGRHGASGPFIQVLMVSDGSRQSMGKRSHLSHRNRSLLKFQFYGSLFGNYPRMVMKNVVTCSEPAFTIKKSVFLFHSEKKE